MDAEVLNAGGVQRLVIVSDDSFASSPILGEWDSIVYADAPYICEVLMPHDSCQFSITKNGQVFVTTISFDIAKLTAELRVWLTKHSERRWLAYVLDNNDLTHVAGFPGHGGELQFGQTSAKRGGKNGSTFSLEISSLYLPYITDMGFEELTDTTEKLDLRRYAKRDICVYAGDTVDVSFTFRDDDGNIQNLNGSAFELKAVGLDNASFSVTMQSGLSLANSNTELRLLITQLLFGAGTYTYDIHRIFPDATRETVMLGKFIIEEQINLPPENNDQDE